jgi:hypothetical protein
MMMMMMMMIIIIIQNIPEKIPVNLIKEPQKTATLGTAHVLQKITRVKEQNN